MKLSLRNKLLMPTIALIVIGSAISTFVSYLNSKNAIEDMASAQISQLADSTASNITSWINGVKLNVGSWSEDVTFKTAVLDTFLGESARETASEKLQTNAVRHSFCMLLKG